MTAGNNFDENYVVGFSNNPLGHVHVEYKRKILTHFGSIPSLAFVNVYFRPKTTHTWIMSLLEIEPSKSWRRGVVGCN